MSLTITKKAKPKSNLAQATAKALEESAPEQVVNREVVQEFLDLTAKIEKHNAKIATDILRADELKKQIVGAVDEVCDAEAKVVLNGTGKQMLEISARSESTSITDMGMVRKFLGQTNFMELVKVTITDARAYLTKPQLDQCTKTERTGARRSKIIGG